MPKIIGTTNFSGAMPALAELVAASATFRSVLAVASPRQALEHIHFPYAEDRIDPADPTRLLDPRPRCIINPCPGFARKKLGTSFGSSDGFLCLVFEFLPDSIYAGDRDAELAAFMEQIGQIMDEIEHKAGQDKAAGEAVYTNPDFTHLNIVEYFCADGPAESVRRNEIELFYGVVFIVEYIG